MNCLVEQPGTVLGGDEWTSQVRRTSRLRYRSSWYGRRKESQGEQRRRRGGRAVHRGVREGSEEQSVQDLESDVLWDLLPATGTGRGDTEAARRWDQNSRHSHRRRQDRSNRGRAEP